MFMNEVKQFEKILTDGLAQMKITVQGHAISSLAVYCRELLKWSTKINLVGKAPANVLLENHFLDSLALLPLIMEYAPTGPLLDVGTGAGFPGLVLKAVCPEVSVTLIEPRQYFGSCVAF